MKKILVTIIFIMILFMYTSHPNIVLGEKEAERIIEIDRYGFIYVIDTLPALGGSIEIGFPRELLRNLVDYYSPDGRVEMNIEDEAFWFRVYSNQSSYSMKLITIFGDLLGKSGADSFSLEFPLNPLTREDLKQIKLRMFLPDWSNISEVYPEAIKIGGDGVTAVGELSLDTTKVNNLQMEFNIGEISSIRPVNIHLKLDLSSNQAEYMVKLNLRDGRTIDGFDFILLNGSRLIETEDLLRKLSNSYDENSGRLRVYFGRVLNVGESQTVIIRFNPPENTFYSLGEDSIIVYPHLPFNISTPDYRVNVILPSMEYISSNIEPIEVKRIYPEKTSITFTLGMLSPLTEDTKSFKIEVKRTLSLSSFIPYVLGASLTIFIVGILVYSLRPVFKPPLREYEEKARKLIEDVEGLIRSCNLVGDLITSRKILDKGYVRPRILEIRNDVSKYISRISSISIDLKKTVPEASDKIDILTNTSKMIEQSIEQLWMMVHKYLSGSMGRKVFDKQVEDVYKNILKNSEKMVRELEALRRSLT